MGFNFGAFVGGLSQQIVGDIEKEEERLAKMEEMAQTEAMRQRAAAASSRRAKQEATETLMGALSMFYSPEVAAQIAQRGELAAEMYLDMGQKAAINGHDPNEIVKLSIVSDDLTDEKNQNTINGITSFPSAKPKEISETTSALGGEIAIDYSAYAQAMAEPAPTHTSFGSALAYVSQQLIKTTDPKKREELLAQQAALEADYKRMEASGQVEKGDPVFNASTLPSVVNEALKNARAREGFKTDDIDGTILNMTEGNQYKSYIAELNAADTLDSTYGYMNDPALTNRIANIRLQATRDLIDYGRRTLADGTSARLKNEPSAENFATNLVSGKYRIGDVVSYVENGITRFYIYTGIPNEDGLPVVVGR